MDKIICFSELSERVFRYLREYSKNLEIVFNGTIIHYDLEEMITFLNKLKKLNVTCVKEKYSYELCLAIYNKLEYKKLNFSQEEIQKIKIKYSIPNDENVEKYILNTIYFVNKTNNENLKYLFENINYRNIKNICNQLKHYLEYYYTNCVNYVLKNRQLVLSEFGYFDENFRILKEFEKSREFPLTLESYEFFENLDDERMDYIIVPLLRFTDFGFSEKIGNYQLVSLTTSSIFHTEQLGDNNLRKTPICFYEENKIWGNSSANLSFKYEPKRVKVCLMENLNDVTVEYFKIFDSSKVSIWFNKYDISIFYTEKGKSPKKLKQYSFKEFLNNEIEPTKEHYKNDSIIKNEVPESPINSP